MKRQVGRPRKEQRIAPITQADLHLSAREKSEGLKRITVPMSKDMENAGIGPVGDLIAEGWTIDEKSKTPDGQRFDMVIPVDRYQEMFDERIRRAKIMEGGRLSVDGRVHEDATFEKKMVSGSQIIADMENDAALTTSQ